MYILKTQATFDSAHFLSGYDGKCANIHGHCWKIEVSAAGNELIKSGSKKGMLIDFSDLKRSVREIADRFDHALIIEEGSLRDNTMQNLLSDGFRIIELPFRPTAENLAKHFYSLLVSDGIPVVSVAVYETDDNCAAYECTVTENDSGDCSEKQADKEAVFPVAEKFVSINGEGVRAGELAAFIRFRGCNLNCTYCDTSWANSEDTDAQMLSADELCGWVFAMGVRNVTLTGGEPLLQKNIQTLINMLIHKGIRTEIETNGSIPLRVFAVSECRPVFTMDYKLPGSGMEDHMYVDNLLVLGKEDTVKFVSGSVEDLAKAKEIIELYRLTEKCHVYFSPVFGEIEPAQIVDFMKENNMNDVRLQLQLHKYIWNPKTKGV